MNLKNALRGVERSLRGGGSSQIPTSKELAPGLVKCKANSPILKHVSGNSIEIEVVKHGITIKKGQ